MNCQSDDWQQQLARRLRQDRSCVGRRERAGAATRSALQRPQLSPRPDGLIVQPHGEVAVRAPRTCGEPQRRLGWCVRADDGSRWSRARPRRPAGAHRGRRGNPDPRTTSGRTTRCRTARRSTAPPSAPSPRSPARSSSSSCAKWLAWPRCLTTRVVRDHTAPWRRGRRRCRVTRQSLRPPGQRILWNSRYGAAPGYPPWRLHTCADERGSRTSAATSRAALSIGHAIRLVRRVREADDQRARRRATADRSRLAVEQLA